MQIPEYSREAAQASLKGGFIVIFSGAKRSSYGGIVWEFLGILGVVDRYHGFRIPWPL